MFKQIVIVDYTGIQDWALTKLQKLSESPIRCFNTIPKDDDEIVERIGDADCVFVSWNTQLRSNVLSSCNNIKYIGMCCSLFDAESANVDVAYAKENGIEVRGIFDYGDEGVIEFILSELIQLLKGIGEYQWKEEPVELTNRSIGIIGLGTTGKMLAKALQVLGADVYYFNRSRKLDAESEGIKYLPLKELLEECEVLSFHIPKNSNVLAKNDFNNFGNGKILINTSLGLVFDKQGFEKWIEQDDNFFISDACGLGVYTNELSSHRNIIFKDQVSGWTFEAKGRLSKKVLDNVLAFVADKNN